MKYRTLLLDFDGTLTKVDMLDFLALQCNKKNESIALREQYVTGEIDGITCLQKRVELIKGLSLSSVNEFLSTEFLLKGYDELCSFIKLHNLNVILVSGNIHPVINYYAPVFNARKVFCSEVEIENGEIKCLDPANVNKNIDLVRAFMKENGLDPKSSIAIGNDVSDIPFFNYVNIGISINARENTAKHASYNVNGDLNDLLKLLVKL